MDGGRDTMTTFPGCDHGTRMGWFAARRAALAAIGMLLMIPSLRAQSILLAEHQGKMYPVRRMYGLRPEIEVDGKTLLAVGSRAAMGHADEYLPLFVSVHHVNVSTSTGITPEGGTLNNKFHFNAQFESPYGLDDVVIALELRFVKGGKSLFLQEVGRLDPRRPRTVSLNIPLTEEMGPGKYEMHLFVGGREILHSGIPVEVREHALDRMVARRIEDVQDEAPKLLVGPAPEYPAHLLRGRTVGTAVVEVLVDRKGRPQSPSVKSATDSAFGEAALEAVRQWRFIPQVRGGRPMEAKVEVPFNFAPPG